MALQYWLFCRLKLKGTLANYKSFWLLISLLQFALQKPAMSVIHTSSWRVCSAIFQLSVELTKWLTDIIPIISGRQAYVGWNGCESIASFITALCKLSEDSSKINSINYIVDAQKLGRTGSVGKWAAPRSSAMPDQLWTSWVCTEVGLDMIGTSNW